MLYLLEYVKLFLGILHVIFPSAKKCIFSDIITLVGPFYLRLQNNHVFFLNIACYILYMRLLNNLLNGVAIYN